MTKTPKIVVHRRARPIRFAFLVEPDDHAQLLSAFQANTVLWGGRYNPIIPVFDQTPGGWRAVRGPDEIVRGMMDVFEPDFVVVRNGIDAAAFGGPATHTLDLNAMLTLEGHAECGLGVMSAYQRLYKEEVSVLRREPMRFVLPVFEEPAWSLFGASCFGSYPTGPLDFIAKGFQDLGGVSETVNDLTFWDAPTRGASPLTIGSMWLDEKGISGPWRTFFVLDPTVPLDVIDFWNLRALGWRIRPLPIQSAPRLVPQVLNVLQRDDGRSSVLPGSVTRATILKARSVSDSAFSELADALRPAAERAIFQTWMPRLEAGEDRTLARSARVERVEVSAADAEVDATVDADRISFSTLVPEFVGETFLERPRLANVLTLRSFDAHDLAALVPNDGIDLDRLTTTWGTPNMLRTSSEGLTVLTDGARLISWGRLTGIHVYHEWLKPMGDVVLSGPGKIARRFLEIVGGPERERLVNGVELVKLLGNAAKSASGDVSHEELLPVLLRLLGNNRDRAERRINALVRQNVLRFGMRVQCESCAQRNWYALSELGERLTCRHCLDEFAFPMAMPPRPTPWSYRPLGPFGVKGFAQGAYVVAASLRMFAELGGRPRMTWVPSIECRVNGQAEWEADFAALWRTDHPPQGRIQKVFGECKTFDVFDEKDVAKMRRIGAAFPGAVLVFATFRDGLSAAEITLLESVATSGRELWRAPVMILTSRELTSDFGPPFCWRTAGGAFTRMADAFMHAPGTSLRRIADATQQLYLGIPPDTDWPHREAP